MPASEPRPRRPLKPPPNYSSKKVQAKLFLLVAACMGVLYLVTEAAKPDRWGWFFGQPPVAEKPAEPPPEEVVTTLPHELDAVEDADGVMTIADPFRGSLDDRAALEAADPVARAQADGWSAFYEQASRDEHDLVAKGLKFASEPRALQDADAAAWSELLAKIDSFWRGYRQHALEALEPPPEEAGPDAKTLSDAEKEKWIGVLDDVDAAWQSDRAVLAKLAQRDDIAFTPEEQERLRLWQLRWERLALAAIKDDTVHRPAEADAWFRLFDVLNSTTQQQLESQPATDVGFVQLFKQADEYRGKLVRVQGRIMQAKRIKATRNVYGIEHQYLLWIKPEGGPNSPIVVYALEMPEGFPALDKPTLDGGYTKLREDVTVTGYFFKRWAYPGQQGTHTAPLILAKAPHWRPGPDLTARNSDLPSRTTFLSWVAGSALFGLAVALIAYQLTRARSPAVESFETSPNAQRELDASLGGAQAGPSAVEALQLLEQRDRGYEGKQT